MICFGIDPVLNEISSVDDDNLRGSARFSEEITHWIVDRLEGHSRRFAYIMRPVSEPGQTLSSAVIHRMGMWHGILTACDVEVSYVAQNELPELATAMLVAIECLKRKR